MFNCFRNKSIYLCKLKPHFSSSYPTNTIFDSLRTRCCCSVTKSCSTLWAPSTVAHQSSLSITISQSLPKFMSIESVMPSNHLILCHPVFLLLQSFLASGSFPMSQLFESGGQSIGASASASASVLPMKMQGWFPLGLTGFISLQFKGISKVFSSTTVWKHQFFGTLPSLLSSSHIRTWLLERP